MSFHDWNSRSLVYKNVMISSVPTDKNIKRACQAAYKAGLRQGIKDAEATTREVLFDLTKAASIKTKLACGNATGMKKKIDLFVNCTQIAHDVCGTDI